MKQTKLIVTFIGIGLLIILAVFWLVQKSQNTTLWGLWFAAFTALVIQYSAANVIQSNNIAKNFQKELVNK